MSASVPCKCTGDDRRDNWRISQFRCNHSAFNGHHETPSDYSSVRCLKCYGIWRTKAKYVMKLPMLERDTA